MACDEVVTLTVSFQHFFQVTPVLFAYWVSVTGNESRQKDKADLSHLSTQEMTSGAIVLRSEGFPRCILVFYGKAGHGNAVYLFNIL